MNFPENHLRLSQNFRFQRHNSSTSYYENSIINVCNNNKAENILKYGFFEHFVIEIK